VEDLQLLETRVRRLFAERLNLDIPSTDTDVIDTGLVDSLMFVEFLAQLEEIFGVSVALEDLALDNFRTVSRIARSLADKRSAFENHRGGRDTALMGEAQMEPPHTATLGLRRGAA